MAYEEEPHQLEDLEKKLYRRDVEPEPLQRTELHSRIRPTTGTWQPPTPAIRPAKQPMAFLAKVLIFAVIFFLGTLAIAGFVIWRGTNQISGSNIDMQIRGPVAVRAGDETALQITVANRNATELQNAKLIVSFPSDTKSASSTVISLARLTENLGTVDSGAAVSRTVRGVFFGAERETKTVTAKMEYRIPGSNALYTKEAEISFTISAPSVGLTIDVPPDIVVGEEMELKVTVLPKAGGPIKESTLLALQYPAGFTFLSADVPPTFGNNAWLLDDAEAGKGKVITVTGTLSGLAREKKTFRAAVGTQDLLSEDEIAFVYNELAKTVTVGEPFVSLDLAVNGDSGTSPIIRSGELVRVDLEWLNNLPTAVTDGVLTLKLTGAAVDKTRVVAGNGFYRTSEDTISWTKNGESDLGSIKPGATGRVSFTFYTKPLSEGELMDLRNPSVSLEALFTGTRTSEDFASQKITTTLSRAARFQSVTQFSATALHFDGPIENQGPVPPRVGQETTYTVVWTVANSSNALRDALVRTTLPPHVTWKNVQHPAGENIVFNPTSRELVWNLGRILPGPTREVAFQLAVTPELSLLGKTLDLTGKAEFRAFDTYAEKVIQEDRIPVTTRIESDSRFESNYSTVVR